MATKLMGVRLGLGLTNSPIRARVYFDTELEEYCVKFTVRGVYQKNADYFDSDRQSAFETAEHFCRTGA